MNKIMLILAVAVMFMATSVCLAQTAPAADTTHVLAALSAQIDQAVNADGAFKTLAKEKLLSLCTNPVFVAAVKARNSKAVTLDAIKKIDTQWSAAEDELPVQKEMLNNAVATEIRKISQDIPTMSEVFVMDNQGANVGQNSLTSDYWQGDEPKFINSFNAGKGGIDVDKPKLDKSTNRVDQKISLPIIDTDGTVIGAICIGVKS